MTRRKLKIVPPAVLGFVAVGVVPVLLANCGGGNQEMRGVAAPAFTPTAPQNEAGPPPQLGVAAPAFSNNPK
jgi:hypothetical protein